MTTARESTLLERLTFFSDAVFAIAITLLVIEIRPTQLHWPTEQGLQNALASLVPHYVGFVVSFLVIGRFWLGHHRLFGQLAKSDDRLIFANLLLLLGIAFMPFPTAVFSENAGLRTAVWFYTGWLVVLGLLNANVVRLAVRPDMLAADHDAQQIRRTTHGTWMPILIGFAGALAAFVHPTAVLAVLVLGPVLGTLLVNRTARLAPRGRATPGDEEQPAGTEKHEGQVLYPAGSDQHKVQRTEAT